jgi:uncharacterized Zn finger protein
VILCGWPLGEVTMNCPRCQGLMQAINMTEVATSQSVSSWRCLLCGAVTDAVIEENRKGHREPVISRARLPIGSSV